jgi:hypothetical protein
MKGVVRDSSAVRRLFFRLDGAVGRQRNLHTENSGFAHALLHFHVSWLSDFIFYPKSLYTSLHQSFFYSFITILPLESGVRDCYTPLQHDFALDQHFAMLTFIFEPTNVI